ADTPSSQRASCCVYLSAHLPVRSRCRTWDIDERNSIHIGWLNVREEQVEHAHIGDVDVGERASKSHDDLLESARLKNHHRELAGGPALVGVEVGVSRDKSWP